MYLDGVNKILTIICSTSTPDLKGIRKILENRSIFIVSLSYEHNYDKNTSTITYKVNVKSKSSYSELFTEIRKLRLHFTNTSSNLTMPFIQVHPLAYARRYEPLPQRIYRKDVWHNTVVCVRKGGIRRCFSSGGRRLRQMIVPCFSLNKAAIFVPCHSCGYAPLDLADQIPDT